MMSKKIAKRRDEMFRGVKEISNASPVRQRTRRSREQGIGFLGAYRGEQFAHWECIELLKEWGNVRVAAKLQKHFGMDDDGSITICSL